MNSGSLRKQTALVVLITLGTLFISAQFAGASTAEATDTSHLKKVLRENSLKVTPWDTVDIYLPDQDDEIWLLVEWESGRSASPRILQASILNTSGEISYGIYNPGLVKKNEEQTVRASDGEVTTVFSQVLGPNDYYFVRIAKIDNDGSASHVTVDFKVVFISCRNDTLMLVLTGLIFFFMSLFPGIMAYLFEDFGKPQRNR